MGVDSDLIRGHVDTIILNILATSDSDKYGYEIIKDVEDKSNGSYELKQPTLYSCLKRMENNELITSYWVDSDIGGRRKYYKITDKGKEAFNDNLVEWQKSKSIIDTLINTPQNTTTEIDTKATIQESAEDNLELADNQDITSSDNVEENQINNDQDEEQAVDFFNIEHHSINLEENVHQTSMFEIESSSLNEDDSDSSLDIIELEIAKDFENEEISNFEESDDNPQQSSNFDISDFYSDQSEQSFFEANKNGEISRFSFIKPTPALVEGEVVSASDIENDDNLVNYISSEALDISEDEEDDFEDFSIESRLKKREQALSQEELDEEETDYFNIKLDDDDDEVDTLKTLVDDSAEKNSEKLQDSAFDNDTYTEKGTAFTQEIALESQKTTKLNSVGFEDVLNETQSAIQKENASLFEKLDNLRTYTPRYTDTEYKNILGGLTSYTSPIKTPKLKEEFQKAEQQSAEVVSFAATQEKLLKDGVSVKIYKKRERESIYSRTFLLTNKIKMANSWLVFTVMLALLTATYFLAERLGYLSLEFNQSILYFIVAAGILFIIPATQSLIYFSNPMKKHIPKYAPRASLLFSVLFFIQCLVLVYAINLPFGFYSFYQTDYNHLNWLVPSVCSLVFLLNSIFYTLLFRSKNFHI